MLEFQHNPLHGNINEACSIGQSQEELPAQILWDKQVNGKEKHEISLAQHQNGAVVPCIDVFPPNTYFGIIWRQILSWYPIEWAIFMVVVIVLGKTNRILKKFRILEAHDGNAVKVGLSIIYQVYKMTMVLIG